MEGEWKCHLADTDSQEVDKIRSEMGEDSCFVNSYDTHFKFFLAVNQLSKYKLTKLNAFKFFVLFSPSICITISVLVVVLV